MAYSQFNYKKVRSELGIHNKGQALFTDVLPLFPSAWLKETIEMSWQVALFSEKSRSEGIVFPILLEIRKQNIGKISLYSGPILNADDSKGLNGECDFILGKGEQDYALDVPLFCMIEAEDNDIEKNIPQCIAQMEGARTYNRNEGKPTEVIYGCVTTGTEWQFLKLDGTTCFVDTQRYYIDKLENILGVLQSIVNFYDVIQKS